MIKLGHCPESELALSLVHAATTPSGGADMASLSSLFSGLTRGLVMDELDAWAEAEAEDETATDSGLRLVPVQRPTPEPVIDLTDARFELDD